MKAPTWLFGYGFLIWRADFPWLEARRAHIMGWSWRFWHGSHDHRSVATTNHAFLGEAPMDEIAAHINRCSGPSGTNLDNLLQLARELRNLDISDPHVFERETLVLATQK